MTSTPTSWGLLKQPYKQESTNVDQDGHYYRHLAMIFPSRSQLASKQITRTGRAEAVTKEGLAATLLPRTSARSNGTTSFSTASTSSIVPGSAKERVLMLYFNTNVGATLTPTGNPYRALLAGPTMYRATRRSGRHGSL